MLIRIGRAEIRRRMRRMSECPWAFKSVACGYSGDVEECDKTIECCTLLDNEARFAGYPKEGYRTIGEGLETMPVNLVCTVCKFEMDMMVPKEVNLNTFISNTYCQKCGTTTMERAIVRTEGCLKVKCLKCLHWMDVMSLPQSVSDEFVVHCDNCGTIRTLKLAQTDNLDEIYQGLKVDDKDMDMMMERFKKSLLADPVWNALADEVVGYINETMEGNQKMKETKKSLFPWAKEVDISMELFREYVFPGGERVKVDAPTTLMVSDNGHRVGDVHGISHYIPYGWIHLYWHNKPDRPDMFYYQTKQREQKEEMEHLQDELCASFKVPKSYLGAVPDEDDPTHIPFWDVCAAIRNELKDHAGKLWNEEFDGLNTPNDWVAYVIQYLGEATKIDRDTFVFDPLIFEEQMIKAAGLCISAIMTCKRLAGNMARRHYDQ